MIIDGKKLLGEDPKSRVCDGLYILNAIVSEYEICITEKRVDDKTNELAMLPSVIASLCIVRALVSVDAMGTHRNIAQQILLQDGKYLMALKDNQPILKGLVESIFDSTRPLAEFRSEEKGHGRTGMRQCSILDTRLLRQEGIYEERPGLKRIIRMYRERTCDGAKSKRPSTI